MIPKATTSTPLPLQKVCLLGLILSANNTSIWMIFSFLPFMVEFYFPYLSKTELGYRAGILGSAFSAGSLLGNLIWGTVSDRFGRRPALLCGLLGTAISSILFGFSPTFTMAVASRFMWGLLNGNIGVAKTYLAEICDDSNSAKGMALFGVIGGFGRSIGPVIGGFLSSPAKSFPKIFKGTIFDTFPFALPSLIIAANCLFVFLVALFTLTETLPSIVNGENREIASSSVKDSGIAYSLLHEKDDDEDDLSTSTNNNNSIEMTAWNNHEQSSNTIGDADESKDSFFETPSKKRRLTFAGVVTVKTIGSQALGFGPLKGIDAQDQPVISTNQSRSHSVIDSSINDIELGESHLLDDGTPSPPYSPLPHALLDKPHQPPANTQQLQLHTEEGDDHHHEHIISTDKHSSDQQIIEEEDDDDEQTKLIDPHSKHREVVGRIRYTNGSEDETVITRGRTFWNMIANIFQQPEIMISTALYGTNALSIIVFNEIFPLWVVTSIESGGFEFTSYQIGISTMVSGVLGIILQVTLYPYMTDRLGVLFVHKAGVVAFAASCVLVPCVSLVNGLQSSFLTWLVIIGSQLVINVTSTWVLVSVFVLINNSCYSYQRATVNGLGQTFASIGRLMGPFLGANLFAWSENNGLDWPLNFYLTFYVMAMIGFGNWVLANQLPNNIQRRKKEPGVPMPPRRRRRTYADEDDSSGSNRTEEEMLRPTHPTLPAATQRSNLSKGQGLPIDPSDPSAAPS